MEAAAGRFQLLPNHRQTARLVHGSICVKQCDDSAASRLQGYLPAELVFTSNPNFRGALPFATPQFLLR
jgi:hypothetical protein